VTGVVGALLQLVLRKGFHEVRDFGAADEFLLFLHFFYLDLLLAL
jgi:hypothetical protein